MGSKMKTTEELECIAYANGDTAHADLLARIVELETEVENLESQLEDAQADSLSKWEKNNSPIADYVTFFDECFQRLGGHYPCASVTSDYDCGIIYAAIERGEGVVE